MSDVCFFFSSRRRHTRFDCDWSSDVCSSDIATLRENTERPITISSGTNRLLKAAELVAAAEEALEGKWPKGRRPERWEDRKSTRLNSSHSQISYAVFCLKKKKNIYTVMTSP